MHCILMIDVQAPKIQLYPGNATCSDPEFCFDFTYFDDFDNASLDYDRYDKNIVSSFSSRNSISPCHWPGTDTFQIKILI